VGYYYEPPRGSGGGLGVRAKPIPLGYEMLQEGEKASGVPPPRCWPSTRSTQRSG